MEQRNRRKRGRLPNYSYTTPGYYFLTICAKTRNEDVFSSLPPVGAAALGGPEPRLTRAGTIVQELIEAMDGVYANAQVDSYVIMPDHIHLLLSLEDAHGSARNASISQMVNALKALAVKRFGKPLWQRGFYDHVIRGTADRDTARAYIRDNPARLRERSGAKAPHSNLPTAEKKGCFL